MLRFAGEEVMGWMQLEDCVRPALLFEESKLEFNEANPGEFVSRCMALSHHKPTLQNIRNQERIIHEIPKVFGDFNQLQLQ